jgi:hypothetical protein
VTAKKLAEFLESIENEENVLAQRLSDLETRSIYSSSPMPPPKGPPEISVTKEPVLSKPAMAQAAPAYSTYGEM